MTSLPASALLCLWLEAVRVGRAGPDELAAVVRGDDPRHLVVGSAVAGGTDTAVDLQALPRLLGQPARLALPVAGDPLGLGGPSALNSAALEAGEAVLVGQVALVPELDARTVVWRTYDADPAPYVDERETSIELRVALSEVTGRLVDLDVVAWQPEIPDLLMNLRSRPALVLPPGLDARRVDTIERAVLCREIAALALGDDGGSVSTHEMGQRRAALADLERAARHALVGACSARG